MVHVDPRYRREGDTVYVELSLRTIQQLFDARDPAPFCERDLDPAALEYLFEAADDLPRGVPMALIFSFSDEVDPPVLTEEALTEAVRRHLGLERARLRRKIRRMFQHAGVAALIGLSILALSLGLVDWLDRVSTRGAAVTLREGVTILAWVALWRPLESVLYEWWPLWERVRALGRVQVAPMRVEVAKGAPRPRSVIRVG